MRVWDIPCEALCDRHLLAEHRELHGIFNIITKGKRGYAKHPETVRWRRRLAALWLRHNEQILAAAERGWPMGREHKTPIPMQNDDDIRLTGVVDSVAQQKRELRAKGCGCRV